MIVSVGKINILIANSSARCRYPRKAPDLERKLRDLRPKAALKDQTLAVRQILPPVTILPAVFIYTYTNLSYTHTVHMYNYTEYVLRTLIRNNRIPIAYILDFL